LVVKQWLILIVISDPEEEKRRWQPAHGTIAVLALGAIVS